MQAIQRQDFHEQTKKNFELIGIYESKKSLHKLNYGNI